MTTLRTDPAKEALASTEGVTDTVTLGPVVISVVLSVVALLDAYKPLVAFIASIILLLLVTLVMSVSLLVFDSNSSVTFKGIITPTDDPNVTPDCNSSSIMDSSIATSDNVVNGVKLKSNCEDDVNLDVDVEMEVVPFETTVVLTLEVKTRPSAKDP